MICGFGGSKSRLAKATGQMRDEQLHAFVARSTFASETAQDTSRSEHFLKLRCRKSARRCGAKHISKSKCIKHTRFRALFEVAMSKKCTPLWREAHFQVKMYKTHQVRTTFGSWDVEKSAHSCGAKRISKSKCEKHHMLGPLLDVQMSFRVAGARDCAPCQKWAKCEGFVAFSKTMAGVGHLKRICKHAFSVAGAVQETSSSELSGSPGADFLRGVDFGASDLQVCWDDFAWQVQDFVWPGITFSWQAQYFRQVEWKNRKTHWHEAVSSALNVPFLKEVSQNCFVFDVVNFEQWRSLADLFRFWCCQMQKLRKSRWIAAFLFLSSSKTEEVSQNSFVFKPADR